MSLAAGAREGTPSPTLSAGPESPRRRGLSCPLPDPFRLGCSPSPPGAPRVPAHSAERANAGLRDARRDTPSTSEAGCPFLSPPSFRAVSPSLSSPVAPGPPWSWHLGQVRCPGWGQGGGPGAGQGVCHVQTISKAAFSSLPWSSGLSTFPLGLTQKSKEAHLPGGEGVLLPP